MSAFANEIPLTYRLTAAAVLSWLTKKGRLNDAVVYRQLFSDWADNVELRNSGSFADLTGSHRHTVRATFDRLSEDGILRTRTAGPRRYVELVFEGVIEKLYGAELYTVGVSSGTFGIDEFVQFDSTLAERAEIWKLPVKLQPNRLSPCYVTVYDTGNVLGTDLALSTNTYKNPNTSVLHLYVFKKLHTNTCDQLQGEKLSNVQSGSTTTAAVEPPPAVTKKSKGKVKSTGQSWAEKDLPATSYGFRYVPLAVVEARDPHFGKIRELHEAWCKALNVEYTLNTFRYSAWREILVEQSYLPEDILSAVPGLLRDPWALERFTDPGIMFKDPGRIERFFPANAKSAPDRLARNTPSTDESFIF